MGRGGHNLVDAVQIDEAGPGAVHEVAQHLAVLEAAREGAEWVSDGRKETQAGGGWCRSVVVRAGEVVADGGGVEGQVVGFPIDLIREPLPQAALQT